MLLYFYLKKSLFYGVLFQNISFKFHPLLYIFFIFSLYFAFAYSPLCSDVEGDRGLSKRPGPGEDGEQDLRDVSHGVVRGPLLAGGG